MNAMAEEKQIIAGMTIEQVLQGLPNFEPVAYYDKHLDVIRVQIMDCSIWEDRLDRIMTIYHANHHLNPNGVDDVVGFAIKGVRHLLMELGFGEKDRPVRLAEFLDAVCKQYPSKSTKLVVELYRSLHRPKNEEVEIMLAEAA